VYHIVGRIASIEVISYSELKQSASLSYYGLEGRYTSRNIIQSIVTNSSLRKIFDTRSQKMINVCSGMFNCHTCI